MEERIAVNQVGYAVHQSKRAFSRSPLASATLVDVKTKAVVFDQGELSQRFDPLLQDTVFQWEFTKFKRPGEYKVVADGASSVAFRISDGVYREIFTLAARSYYLQRCGEAIHDPVTGVAHPVCHNRLATVLETGDLRDVAGGWHDAGDYGRYMQTAGVSTGQLLLLAEMAPDTVAEVRLALSDARIRWPDLWTEVAYELEWMFKMQRDDGAVYHKVNTDRFCAMVLPQEDTEPLWVYDVATPDTAIFAASMARAARVLRPLDQAYAERALAAALRAWKFLATTGPLLHPENGHTGAYLTQSDRDERLWAAAELWLTTGDEPYRDYVENNWQMVLGDPAKPLSGINWEDVSTLVPVALSLDPARSGEALWGRAQAHLMRNAERLLQQIGQHGYEVALEASEYVWASAKAAVAHGLNLAVAHRLSGRKEFLDAALAQWNFVLGANALSQSWLTGAGEASTRHPHNRYVVASGILIPGLLAGGPNANGYRQDHRAPKTVGPLAYIDDDEAFSVNENAIDYNAPLVVLSAYLNEVRVSQTSG